ncbi:MAG TPA: bifunctional adenosylcobinamide kinase/adenosylcobinamide-phosphate guanylyltransferase [Aestuariivirgaceae bacterium]
MRSQWLVIGGARSGKSAYAERLAQSHPGELVYVATGEPGDEEMRSRIAHHRQRRGGKWRTIEEPIALAHVLRKECRAGRFVLVDCMTLWISNLLLADKPIPDAVEELCKLLPQLDGALVLVSNEVGLGIVPDNALARRFRDEAGFANQQIAAACSHVVFIVAGLPLRLKG